MLLADSSDIRQLLRTELRLVFPNGTSMSAADYKDLMTLNNTRSHHLAAVLTANIVQLIKSDLDFIIPQRDVSILNKPRARAVKFML
jgi:hypothetical protein